MSDAGNLTGKRLGDYHILELIGHGGFGDVYKGQHVSQNNLVAIKVLHSDYNAHDKQKVANYRAQFFSEARMLQTLKHPFIMPLLHVGEQIIDPGQKQSVLYMVMEYAQNGSLRKYLNEYLKKNPGQPLPLQEALTILWQIGQALYFAHQQLKGEEKKPVVHLDLKPENILFNDQGDALLADFGLAISLLSNKTMLVSGSRAMGTPEYMAPEQFKGEVSIKSDQYALGIVSYELLTGQRPFSADGALPQQAWGLLYIKHQAIPPEAPLERNSRLSTNISEAILKALAKDRAKRYDNILNFIEALGPPQPGTFTDWYSKGHELYELRKFKDAITAYRQGILLKPDFASIHCNRGLAHYNLKQYQDAIIAFNHAITFNSGHVKAYFHKGIALKQLGRLEEAADMYQKTVEIDPKHGVAFEYLGDALYSLEQYAEAVIAYKRAVYLNPHEAKIFTNLGLALKNCHADREARDAFEFAIRLDPEYARAYYSIGNLLSNQRAYEEALKAYKKAIDIDPNYANAFRAKSNALRSLGLLEEARLAEEKANELDHKDR